jgi:WD40 repeat protein
MSSVRLPKLNIQEIAVSEDADLFASVTSERTVSVWSLRDRRKIKDFQALWSLGGHRIHLSAATKPILVTASWERGKAAAYDACTGTLHWSVSLSHVQYVSPIEYMGAKQLGFATDDKGIQIRDPLTGAYLKNLRGIEKAFQSPFGSDVLLVKRRKQLALCAKDLETINTVPLVGFAVLHAAFSSDFRVLVSEAGGPIRCFELTGSELWRLQQPNRHAVRVCWSSELKQWLGIMHRYQGEDGPTNVLVSVDRERIVEIFELGIGQFEFSSDAKMLFGTDQTVRSIPSGEIVWNFG